MGVVALLAAIAGESQAQEPTRRAGLLVTTCPANAARIPELREAVALELRTQDVELGAPEVDALDEVRLEVEWPCEADDADVVLRASSGSDRAERRLGLRDVPENGRPRALALSLAELLAQLFERASATESAAITLEERAPLEETAPSAVPAAAASPTAPPAFARAPAAADAPQDARPARKGPRAANQGESAVRIAVAPEARVFLKGTTTLGGRAELDIHRFRLGLGMLGHRSADSGGVVTGTIVNLLLSVRAKEWRSRGGSMVALGPRLGLGTVHAEGTAFSPELAGGSYVETYTDAALFVDADLALGGAIRAGAGGELGYGRGLVASVDGEATGFYGGWFSGMLLRLSVGL